MERVASDTPTPPNRGGKDSESLGVWHIRECTVVDIVDVIFDFL
jgi:hypothetical protein